MPLYQYECEKCGERFDVRQKFVDAPLTVHENCGGEVKRLLSAPALQFKGSGFYITDYAKGSNSPANGGEKKAEGSTAKSGDSDSGSKPAAAATTTTSETKPSSSDSKPSSSDTK